MAPYTSCHCSEGELHDDVVCLIRLQGMTSRLLCEEYHSYTIIHSAYSSVQITRETQVMLHVIYNIGIVVLPVAKLLTRVEELLLFCSTFL